MKQKFMVHVTKAVLIWLATNAFGTLLVTLLFPSLTVEDLQMGISITLTFSSPVIVVLVPITLGLSRIKTLQSKIIYSVSAVLLLSIAVLVFFVSMSGIPGETLSSIAGLAAPYFVTAQLSFLSFNMYALK